jgi:hypothetical protein
LQGEIVALAECYANKCFAEEVKEKFVEAGLRLKVIHKHKYGRDRILQEAHHMASRQPSRVLVLFIDYELGPFREFVSVEFPGLKSIRSSADIYLGRSRRASNLFAVVFDPNIEDALGVRDDDVRRALKTRRACRELKPILESKRGVVEEVARELVSLIAAEG